VRRKLPERERRRIATRRERHGDDFDSRNARHAASFSQTKFNSKSGSAAAKLRWQRYREERARKAQQPINDQEEK
jgi:hypothetical protein